MFHTELLSNAVWHTATSHRIAQYSVTCHGERHVHEYDVCGLRALEAAGLRGEAGGERALPSASVQIASVAVTTIAGRACYPLKSSGPCVLSPRASLFAPTS